VCQPFDSTVHACPLEGEWICVWVSWCAISQQIIGDIEKQYDNLAGGQWFFIEKNNGTKIGYIVHFKVKACIGIGYVLVPNERSKGYGSEAVQMMVDHLFLTKNIVRIEAETHPQNGASSRILKKAGFSKEDVIRKSFFSRGVWGDTALYSILREARRETQDRLGEEKSGARPETETETLNVSSYTWTSTSPKPHPRGTPKTSLMIYPRYLGAGVVN